MRKILLDKDNASKAELKDLFTKRKGSNLVLPTELVRELDEYCQGCGEPFRNKKQVEYFGQTFCSGCVEKWMNGKD